MAAERVGAAEDKPEVGRPVPAVPAVPARDPAAERVLLDKAQAALSSGDVATALALTEQHAQRYARGALVEERLSLRVRALIRADRVSEAEQRADELRRRYPHSIHLPAVAAMLERARAPR